MGEIAGLKKQELVALEYLVSSACNFLVELHEDAPGEFHFEPALGSSAEGVGEFQLGQRFWSMYNPKHFADPFQAAIMFVNAFRVWESKMKEVETRDRQRERDEEKARARESKDKKRHLH